MPMKPLSDIEITYQNKIAEVFAVLYTKEPTLERLQTTEGLLGRVLNQAFSTYRTAVLEAVEGMKRTDETQMSHDHVYDEALDDVSSLLAGDKGECCERCYGRKHRGEGETHTVQPFCLAPACKCHSTPSDK